MIAHTSIVIIIFSLFVAFVAYVAIHEIGQMIAYTAIVAILNLISNFLMIKCHRKLHTRNCSGNKCKWITSNAPCG